MDTSLDSGASGSAAEPPLVGVDGRGLSLKAVLVALLALAAGAFAGGSVPFVGGLGRVIGIAGAAFVFGLVSPRRRYVETGVAGVLVGVASAVAGLVSATLLPVGVDLLREYGLGVGAVGATLGLLPSLIGHYFGRDLRAGLTRDVEG